MRLTIIGSGTGIPSPFMASPCLYLWCNGHRILLDMGPGSLRQLERAGITFTSIDSVLITHFHPDHVNDLPAFLFALKNPNKIKYLKRLSIIGPPGLLDFYNRLLGLYGNWIRLPEGHLDIVEIKEHFKENVLAPGVFLSAAPTKHTGHSVAYKICSGGNRSLVYSGDASFCEEIIEFSKGADILVLEAALPDGTEEPGHLTPSQACLIAQRAGAKKLVLTHFYPEVLCQDISTLCRKHYTGTLILAKDLISVEVP